MDGSDPTTFDIPDLETGFELIARWPLANPLQAQIDISRFLDSLRATPPDGETYFRLLEHARLPISFVAEELARRYLNKPLPLAELEETFFQQVVTLSLKTARAYAHCAESDAAADSAATSLTNDGARALRAATILHRCLHYTGRTIIEHQRTRRELPRGVWLDLHAYYSSAEEWGLAKLPVPDALDSLGRAAHCTAAYVAVQLCELAGSFSLPVRDQTLVQSWASQWSPLVSVHRAEPGQTLPLFVVDLMHDVALRPTADCLQTDHLRCLDTSRLALQIRQIRHQLRQKVPPAQLALGESATAGQCGRLLERLARSWSQARAPRKFRRHPTSGVAHVSTGFDEMHFFMSGHEFEQPENVRFYSRREFDTLFAFRHQEDSSRMLELRQEQLGFHVDTWEVVNQSANGFRLMRSTSGKKMVHGQLLALCPHDGERYLLAQVTWLMQERAGGLIAGIRALPGLPEAIAVRPLEHVSGQRAQYHRAFLLPATPPITSEPSLVLPAGWFKPGRHVELYTDGGWRVELCHVLDGGQDFDRASFVAA
ncbi:MAG: hypothetical protein ABI478_01555 [Propionivibrio sp.]